jgi:hypothetical protein
MFGENGREKIVKKDIVVQDTIIKINIINEKDYISLTDIARYRDAKRSDYILQNWMRSKDTIIFLGLWERINNPDFNSIEFDGIKNQAGVNSFTLTPKQWIKKTNAIGIVSKAGRYGGTYAHKDIAFEFASWISAEFKLFLIKEFQRLKESEINRDKLDWDIKRTIVKMNYHIHTDAIKNNLIPPDLTMAKKQFIYANEADLLNIALFGMTAKEWKDKNPNLKGNMRDYATVEQLVVLANLEAMNAEFIKDGLEPSERVERLNKIAIEQLGLLLKYNNKEIDHE